MDGFFSHPLRHNLIDYKFGEHLEESLWMDGMFTKMCFTHLGFWMPFCE
jgi:hypothetical protein